MNNELKIIFNQEFKSFKIGSEYLFNGQLIVLSGINGAGKSQLLESIKQQYTDVYINNIKISHNNILKYSFRDNINLPTFGTYDYDVARSTDNAIINIYNNLKNLYTNYITSKRNNPEYFERDLGITPGTTIEEYCIDNIGASISIKKDSRSVISKNISKSTIVQIINSIFDPENDNWLNLSNEEILQKIPSDLVVKLENDEIEGITRIFTEAARLRFLERNKYADTTEKFDNEKWLKKAPWTEINNLFEKLHFNYRFAKDYEYEIPYLKEEPKLYAYENNEINKLKVRNINDLSDGEKAILKLVVSTYDKKEDEATKLLLLDEYDAALNPSLIKDFYLALQEYYLNKGIIVLITTHSPITISMAPKNSRFYEIFRQNDNSPIIMEVNKQEYEELKILENYYSKIRNPELRLKELEGENSKLKEKIENMTIPLVVTEGKTDWKHIKKAKEKLNNHDSYEFYETLEDMGDTAAFNMLKEQSKINNSNKRIFIFDNDNENIVKDVSDDNSNYKNWGNNVFSFVIPKPNIRENEDKISIEHYYPEEILKKEVVFDDGIIRRIYSGNDFQKTGINVQLNKRCNKKDVCGENIIRILSGAGQEKVFDLDNEDNNSTNYALTKDDFFEKVINNEENDIDMSKFNLILNIIKEIIDL